MRATEWVPIDKSNGDLFTLEEFEQMVKSGSLIDWDGSATWATATLELRPSFDEWYEGIGVPKPSTFPAGKPEQATHVMWYNK